MDYIRSQYNLCLQIKQAIPYISEQEGKDKMLKYISKERQIISQFESRNSYDVNCSLYLLYRMLLRDVKILL